MANKGWFEMRGRDGDRRIEQQMVGLEKLVAEVEGKTVLDVGCAEGLIGVELAKAGAKRVVGIDKVPVVLDVARRYSSVPGVTEYVLADAGKYKPTEQFDIVLLLAILHKLTKPVVAVKRLAEAAKSLVVVRLPQIGAVITHPRSGGIPHDMSAVLKEAGFDLESETRETFNNEWIGYYRRRTVVAVPPPAPPVAPPPAPEPAAPEPEPAAPEPEITRSDMTSDFLSQETEAEAMERIKRANAAEAPNSETPVPEEPQAETPPPEEANVRPAEAEPEVQGGRPLFPQPEQARVQETPTRVEPEASEHPEAPGAERLKPE